MTLDSDILVYEVTKYLDIVETYSLRTLSRDIYLKMTLYLQQIPKKIYTGYNNNAIVVVDRVAFVYHYGSLLWVVPCKQHKITADIPKTATIYSGPHTYWLYDFNDTCCLKSSEYYSCRHHKHMDRPTCKKLFELHERPNFIAHYSSSTFIMMYDSQLFLCDI